MNISNNRNRAEPGSDISNYIQKGTVYKLVFKHICIAAKLTCSFKKDLKEKAVMN